MLCLVFLFPHSISDRAKISGSRLFDLVPIESYFSRYPNQYECLFQIVKKLINPLIFF